MCVAFLQFTRTYHSAHQHESKRQGILLLLRLQKRLGLFRQKERKAMRITEETRRESYNTVKLTLTARHKIVLAILQEFGDLTAQEVADTLCYLCVTPTNERNFAAPRLTELCDKGMVRVVGKKVCKKTGRTVSVWSATGNVKKTATYRRANPAGSESVAEQLGARGWQRKKEQQGKTAGEQHIYGAKRCDYARNQRAHRTRLLQTRLHA
jgi:hypothetical protein